MKKGLHLFSPSVDPSLFLIVRRRFYSIENRNYRSTFPWGHWTVGHSTEPSSSRQQFEPSRAQFFSSFFFFIFIQKKTAAGQDANDGWQQ
jgi:hypothetical protein